MPRIMRDREAIVAAGMRCLIEQGPADVIANAGISVGIDTAEREDLAVLEDLYATNVVRHGRDLSSLHPADAAGAAAAPGRQSPVSQRSGAARAMAATAAARPRWSTTARACASSCARTSVVTLLPGFVDTP